MYRCNSCATLGLEYCQNTPLFIKHSNIFIKTFLSEYHSQKCFCSRKDSIYSIQGGFKGITTTQIYFLLFLFWGLKKVIDNIHDY